VACYTNIMSYLYSFTPEIVPYLQAIERARAEVSLTVLPPALAERIRLRARVQSTHISTQIEGNRLSMIEAEQVLIEGRVIPGRERDTLEVKLTFQGLEQVETWVEAGQPVTEEIIRKLHARDLLTLWVSQGCLEISSNARKTRRYRLSAE
jgi:Fic family protein